MKSTSRTFLSFATLATLAAAAGTIALAQPAGEHKQPEMKLPPGWTSEDMQACMEAGMPGKHHERLAGMAGTWTGTNKMWMAPGTEPMSSPVTWTMSMVMDGRYLRTDVAGDMMGAPFNGMGITGYDNVSQQLVGTWIDSHSSGIMTGTGEVGADGKSETWKYTFNCPITRKPTVMREVMKHTAANTLAVEFFCTDPKSGKEYKCMEATLTKAAK